MNEFIFLTYISLVSVSSLAALFFGKEALIAFICLQCVLVNLFVTKEILLFGFTATASDALGVGAALSLNLIQEYYGKQLAQKAILVSFFCVIFYILATGIHLSFLPAPTDISQVHFLALLTPMPRIVAASIISYLVTQTIDCHLYGYLCQRLGSKNFIFKNYTSIAITQLIDTIIFSFLGLYMINESFSSIRIILDIIVVSYLIKMFVLVIATPFLAISKKFLKFQPK